MIAAPLPMAREPERSGGLESGSPSDTTAPVPPIEVLESARRQARGYWERDADSLRRNFADFDFSDVDKLRRRYRLRSDEEYHAFLDAATKETADIRAELQALGHQYVAEMDGLVSATVAGNGEASLQPDNRGRVFDDEVMRFTVDEGDWHFTFRVRAGAEAPYWRLWERRTELRTEARARIQKLAESF